MIGSPGRFHENESRQDRNIRRAGKIAVVPMAILYLWLLSLRETPEKVNAVLENTDAPTEILPADTAPGPIDTIPATF